MKTLQHARRARTPAVWLAVIGTLATTILAACGGGDGGLVSTRDPAVLIAITPSNTEISVGATFSFAVQVSGGSRTSPPSLATCTSNEPAVATVARQGSSCLATAVSPGTVSITATASTGGSAAAALTVRALPEAITGVALTPAQGSIAVGGTVPLTPTPTTASPTVSVSYQYTSSAPSIASVNANSGVVTGVAPGSATITVTATGSGTGFNTSTRTATASVTVTAAPDALTGVSLSPGSGSIAVGQTLRLTPTPATASPAVAVSFQFASSASSIASVNASTGVVTGAALGSATITVTATGSGTGFATSTRTATATVTVAANTLGIGFGAAQFAAIPAGSYDRGSNNGEAHEQPVRRISISAFELQKTEVTQAQWRQVMAGTPLENPSGFSSCGDTCPVEQVSWDDVQSFLQRLNQQDPGKNYRLATEAEWEYAARAGTTGDFGIAGAVCSFAWIVDNDCAQNRTWPVAQKPANTWGLHDMHGNVSEWVNDWYDAGYYAVSPASNPVGAASGSVRVMRGGNWGNRAFDSRSAYRQTRPPSTRGGFIGFRLAKGSAPTVLGIGFGAAQFAAIPAGSYNRGSTFGPANEQPVRSITISAFQLQKTEVTQAQWRQVMQGTGMENPSFFSACGETCPVERVSWNDIQTFLQRLNQQDPGKNYRLPTEAEWEYAARAGTTGDYGGNGVLDDMGWWQGNSGSRTHPVAQKRPNAWGLFDMHGNILEWVQDFGADNYYASSPSNNPQGPAGGCCRVLRGGAWDARVENARSATRGWNIPQEGLNFFGFRLAIGPTPPALGAGFGLEEFVAIPAGSYNRGSANGQTDERPVRSIAISAFLMQKTEVTQAQWRMVMTGTALANPSQFSGCDACPVEQVSWDDIQLFLTRLNSQVPGQGFRLPTEAEWEYAARATTTGDFGGSGDVLEMGWIEANSGGRTHPVAGKRANLWGLYDMHGNVYEWVSDWYDGSYYGVSPSANPTGPATGTVRAQRGGDWANIAFGARSAFRGQYAPNDRTPRMGFRLARTP